MIGGKSYVTALLLLRRLKREREFVCNNDLKIHYKYLKQTEKERKLTDAEKADKRNIEILKKR